MSIDPLQINGLRRIVSGYCYYYQFMQFYHLALTADDGFTIPK